MRVELKELLEKLGVDRELSPYETQPWFYYDSEQGISCSAEVRMGPDNEDLEAELQFLYDEPQEEEIEEKDEETGESKGTGEMRSFIHRQIMLMRAKPAAENQWGPKQLFVKGENYTNKFGGWEEKACEFFQSCISSMLMSELPEIDELIEKQLSDDGGRGGGRRGRIGKKSPNIKPGQLLGMKKGM